MGTPHPVVDAPSAALPLPALTSDDIEALTDQGSFSRGRDYRRQDAIRQPLRRGRTLSAFCRGSEPAPYQVRALLADPASTSQKIAAYHCTCPRGGFCKHIVALLLTWIEDPEEFAVLPTTAEILADKSRDDLLRLIDQMIEHDPSLESLVDRLRPAPPPPVAAPGEANVRTVNQTAYRRKVSRLLDDAAYNAEDDYYREYGPDEEYFSAAAEQLGTFVEEGSAFERAGRLADAIAVYTIVAEEAMEYDEKVGDGEVTGVVLDCGSGLLRCLERQATLAAGDRLDASDRAALVETIFNVWLVVGGSGWDEAEDEESFADEDGDDAFDPVAAIWPVTVERNGRDAEAAIAAALTVAERERLEQWLGDRLRPGSGGDEPHFKRAAIRFMFKLRDDGGGDEALLAAYKEAELWDDAASLLLSHDRIDDAVALAGRHLTAPARALAFADQLYARGEDGAARAIRFVDGRLWETEGVKPRDDLAYLDWLSARYAERGLNQQAFETDRIRFKRRPTFRDYEAVKLAAARPGLESDLWAQTRPQLIAELTDLRQWGTLIDIHLHEGEVAQAIAALKELERPRERRTATTGGIDDLFGYYGGLGAGQYRIGVAKAAERDFPDESIRLYRSLANTAIDGRNRQSYATAATYLVAVRRLLENNGRDAEWHELITGLREEHKRLRALKEELDALGLR
jgi:uncharacterized Zn finger protein